MVQQFRLRACPCDPTSRPNLQRTGSQKTDTISLREGEGLLPGPPTAQEKGAAAWGGGSPRPGPPGSQGQAVPKPTLNTLLGGRQSPPSPRGPPPLSASPSFLPPHPATLHTPAWGGAPRGRGPAPHLHMAPHTPALLLPTAPRPPRVFTRDSLVPLSIRSTPS